MSGGHAPWWGTEEQLLELANTILEDDPADDEDWVDTLINVPVALNGCGMHERCISFVERAADLHPEKAGVLLGARLLALAALGRERDARDAVDELRRDHPSIWTELDVADALQLLGDGTEAEMAAERARLIAVASGGDDLLLQMALETKAEVLYDVPGRRGESLALSAAAAEAGRRSQAAYEGRRVPKPGRNAPCTCGSGRKFKHCCGATT